MTIKLLIVDVDGTLTDGTIYYGDDNVEIKGFNIKDGAAIKPLRQLGIHVVFLTGRTSKAVMRRADDLNAIAIQGVGDKQSVLNELFREYNIEPARCAYIGDDLNDFCAMKMCGFKACPADATNEIREICDYISPYKGGHGAVRDICEYFLKHDGKYEEFVNIYTPPF